MRRASTVLVILLCFFSTIVITPSDVNSLTGWQWEELTPMLHPAVGIAVEYNGEIYHIGNDFVQVYTPANDTWWIRRSSILSAGDRSDCTLIGDRIYFIHAWSEAGYYNISDNTFYDVVDPPTTRMDVAVTSYDGDMYVSGGWLAGNPEPISLIEVYSPHNNTWWEISPMIMSRRDHQLVTLGDNLYAIGGANISLPLGGTKTVEKYYPATNNWSFVSDLNNWTDGATPVQGRIVSVGHGGSVDQSEVYYPEYDTWILGPAQPWPSPCCDYSMVTLNSDAYLIGGRFGNGTPVDFFYRWDGLESKVPGININNPSNNDFVNLTVNVSGTASDNYRLQKVEISRDNINWILCIGNETWDGIIALNTGENTIYARATDEFNNTEIVSIQVKVDADVPVITLNSPVNNTIVQPGTLLNFIITDSYLDTVNYSVNGAHSEDFNPPYDIDTTGWADGDYTIEVVATDMVGNVTVRTFNFTLYTPLPPDTTPPTILSVNPVNTSMNVPVNTTVTTVFSEPMDPNSVELAIHPLPANIAISQSWSPDNTTMTITLSRPLSRNSTYTVTITQARDLAGNEMEENYSFSFRTWLDHDNDGIPDSADADDDNDGVDDVDDAFPFNDLEWLDTDGDGIGNNADLDDDNDGVLDVDDEEPLDPTIGPEGPRANYWPYLLIALFLIVVGLIAFIMLPKPGAGPQTPETKVSEEADDSEDDEVDEDLSIEEAESEGTSDGD